MNGGITVKEEGWETPKRDTETGRMTNTGGGSSGGEGAFMPFGKPEPLPEGEFRISSPDERPPQDPDHRLRVA